MPDFTPANADYATRTHAAFNQQGMMAAAGAKLVKVEPGFTVIEFPFSPSFTQQHGFLHAGLVTAIVDSACGFAGFTLLPATSNILTIEFKVNFVAPAKGDRFEAIGRVIRAGRNIIVCEGDVMAFDGGKTKHVARMLTTLLQVAE